MNRFDILQFLNSNPMCHLATVEGDQPRVRGMLMYRADDAGIIFHTGKPKDVFRQIEKNQKVEVCFYNAESGTQVRVAGRAEFLEDQALLHEIVEARPFLKPVVEQHGYDMLGVFRVADGVATVWTMETNLAGKEYIEL